MRAYWDTSALVSLYVPDVHSPAAGKLLVPHAGQILLTGLHELELANAIQLRVFRKEMEPAAAKLAGRALSGDRRQGLYLLAPLPELAFATAARLALAETPQRGTRSLDLLHVAAALELEADVFVSFDAKQRGLAQAAGLKLAR